MKKALVLGVLGLLVTATPALACEDVSGTVQVQSGYTVVSGTQVSDRPTLNGSTTCNLSGGWFVNVWGITTLDGDKAANEVDYTVGWSNDDFGFSAGVYDVQPVGKDINDIYAFSGSYNVSDKLSFQANYYAVSVAQFNDGYNFGPTYSSGFGSLSLLAGREEFADTELLVAKYGQEFPLGKTGIHLGVTVDYQFKGSQSGNVNTVVKVGKNF